MKENNSTKIDEKSKFAVYEKGRLKNPGYHDEIDRLFKFHIPRDSRVLELGCGTGRLLASVEPSYGLGIDIDGEQIEAAKEINKDKQGLEFITGDVEKISYEGYDSFDYIIISDLTVTLKDVQKTFMKLKEICSPQTRVIVQFHSQLWRPILSFATMIGRRDPAPEYNWLSTTDIKNLLKLSGFETITESSRILLPLKIPVLGWFMNRFLAKMPFFRLFCLSSYVVAKPNVRELSTQRQNEYSVSVIVPTKDEKGNIENIFKQTPKMGKWTELIFVDGKSKDGTVEEIKRGITEYGDKWERVLFLEQSGREKGQAVHQGFAESKGDILMILDSDLTMPAEELTKYFEAIADGKGEFVNGCRLVYPMEKEAMRFLNMIANHIFAKLFTWLLGQSVKDTLCGTKVLSRKSYDVIYKNRAYFGDFDPFGDFDLLFGAAKQNLQIVDMPIRYRERTYGEIKIRRWKHGVLLLRMAFIAFKKLKINA